jgi:hypothetical protein
MYAAMHSTHRSYSQSHSPVSANNRIRNCTVPRHHPEGVSNKIEYTILRSTVPSISICKMLKLQNGKYKITA